MRKASFLGHWIAGMLLASFALIVLYYGAQHTGLSVFFIQSETSGENARLHTWAENDDGSSQAFLLNTTITFYGNYTDITTNHSINASGVNCTIHFNDTITPTLMSYSAPAGLYYHARQFRHTGSYESTIRCDASPHSYDILETTDTIILQRAPALYTINQSLSKRVIGASALLADYDNDNHWDLFLLGSDSGSPSFSISRNVQGQFSPIASSITNLYYGGTHTLDYNNDNTTDIIVFGLDALDDYTAKAYSDSGSSFTENLNYNLAGSSSVSILQLDINHDGLPELYYAGEDASGARTRAYTLSSSASATALETYLPNVSDADLNLFTTSTTSALLLTGYNGAEGISRLYHLNTTLLTSFDALSSMRYASSCAADITNDGSMEILLIGNTSTAPVIKLYTWQDGHLEDISSYAAGVTPLFDDTQIQPPSCAFGDYDNDGLSDLVVSGLNKTGGSPQHSLRIYRNTGSGFELDMNASAHLVPIYNGMSFFFDVDLDGDLDLISTGAANRSFGDPSTPRTYIYHNTIGAHHPNKPPLPPASGFQNTTNGTLFTFSWGAGSDDLTPSNALYYNIEIGTNPCDSPAGCRDIISGKYGGSSDPWKGYYGNMLQRRTYSLAIPERTYYWRVQSIDTGFASSSWSAQQIYQPDACTILEDQDWNITTSCTKSDTEIAFPAGRMIRILSGGTLTLNNVDLTFSSAENGTTGITINGGTLKAKDSRINASNNTYCINAASGTLDINTTIFSQAGYDDNCPGILFAGSTINFNANTITDSYAGIRIDTNSNTITSNTISGVTHGAILLGTANTIAGGVLEGTSYDVRALEGNHTLINVSVESVQATGGSNIHLQWQTIVQTANATHNINASVSYYDTYNRHISTFQTNSAGERRLNITHTIHGAETTSLNNYTFIVSKPLYTTLTEHHNITSAGTLTFTLTTSGEPSWSMFMNELTTNFSAQSNYTNMSNVTIGLPDIGVIRFSGTINAAHLDLDSIVSITRNRISIDSARAPGLNVSANITFLNVSYARTPIIMRDGVYCDTCAVRAFNGSTTNASVPSFSAYNTSANALLRAVIIDADGNSNRVFLNEQATAYANYTHASDASLITGADCTLLLDTNTYPLTSDGQSYTGTISMNNTGSYTYQVNCTEPMSEPLGVEGTLMVNGEVTFGLLKSFSGLSFSSALAGRQNHSALPFLFAGGSPSGGGALTQSLFFPTQNAPLISNLTALSKGTSLIMDLFRTGELTLYHTGITAGNTPTIRAYDLRNSQFIANSTHTFAMQGLIYSSIAALDYNNDGLTDIALMGERNGRYQSDLYMNNGSALTHNRSLANLSQGALLVLDYNNDSWSDILLVGKHTDGTCSSTTSTILFLHNHNGTFTQNTSVLPAGLHSFCFGSLAAADYNNDGLIDIIYSGGHDDTTKTTYYLANNASGYSYGANLSGMSYPTTSVGDFDGDGYIDLVLAGSITTSGANYRTLFYRNNNTNFSMSAQNTTGIKEGSLLLYDMDNDHRLDLVLSGEDNSSTKHFSIYKNYYATPNTPPEPPNESMSITRTADHYHIEWGMGWDEHTPRTGLYYNLRAGSNATSDNIISSIGGQSSNPTNGYLGNMMSRRHTTLYAPEQCVWFSVQTIDAGLAQSSFSAAYNISFPETCDNLDNNCVGRCLNGTNKGHLCTTDSLCTNSRCVLKDEGIDLNVNGIIESNETFDFDGDGYPAYHLINYNDTCSGYDVYDCDDTNFHISPGWPEVLGDHIDNNCNGLVDETANPCTCTIGPDSGQPGFQFANDTITTCYTPCRSFATEALCVPDKLGITCDGTPGGGSSTTAGAQDTTSPVYDPGTNHNQGGTPNDPTPAPPQPTPQPPQGNQEGSSSAPEQEQPAEFQIQLLERIISSSVRHTRTATFIGGRTQLTEKIRNVGLFDIARVHAVVTIPKSAAGHSDDIVRITPFTVLDPDPIILFELHNLQSLSEENIQYAFTKNLTQEDLLNTLITINYTSPSEEEFEHIKQIILQTSQALNLTRNMSIDYENNQTTYTLHVDFGDETILHDVTIFEEIPKCLIEIINEKLIESSRPYEIISEDPIIAWKFDTLIKGEEIKYAISAVADEDCANQALALALARDIIVLKQKYTLWKAIMGILLIPLIVLLSLGATRLAERSQNIRRIEKALLVIFIFGLNVLDTLDVLPGDILYIAKITGWIALGYIFYHASLTRLLFGKRSRAIDFIIVLSYFLMVVKDIVAIARSLVVERQVFHLFFDLYNFLLLNANTIETTLFYVAIAGLGIATIVISMRPIEEPSLASALGMRGKPQSWWRYPLRIIAVHLILTGFFIIVFSLVAEWVGIVLDNEFAIFAVSAFIILIIVSRKYTTPISIITIPLDTIEQFYERFLEMVTYRKKVLLVLSGIIILHLLAEIGTSGFSASLGLREDIYAGDFELHTPLFSIVPWSTPWQNTLYYQQSAGLAVHSKLLIMIAYILNLFALLSIMLLPVFLWAHMFHHQDKALTRIPAIRLPDAFVGMFVASIFMLFARPAFSIRPLQRELLTGVDIATRAIDLHNLAAITLLACGLGIIAYAISKRYHDDAKKIVYTLGIIALYAYLALFFSSISATYQRVIASTLAQDALIGAYLALFLLFNILLYAGGSIALLIELYLRKELWFENLTRDALGEWFAHHHLPHIHFFSEHEFDKHGTEEESLIRFILESIEEGHELYAAVDHLLEKGWDIATIEKAVHAAEVDPEYKAEATRIRHDMHRKDELEALRAYLRDAYMAQKLPFPKIYEACTQNGWTDDDIAYAASDLEFREEDAEIAKYLRDVHVKPKQ